MQSHVRDVFTLVGVLDLLGLCLGGGLWQVQDASGAIFVPYIWRKLRANPPDFQHTKSRKLSQSKKAASLEIH